jgi:spore coat protein U-like protein
MNMKLRHLSSAVIALALGGVALNSQAANLATAQFNVKITINDACVMATPGDVDFGSVVANAAPATNPKSTALSIKCSKGTSYKIGLQSSNNSSDSTGAGLLKPASGSDAITYQLYQDSAASTTKWGNTLGTNTLAGSGSGVTGTANAPNVYVKLTGSTDVAVGAYSDIVTVNVTL